MKAEASSKGAMEQMLSLCRPYLPPGLISPDSLAAHLAIARRLPLYFSERFGFEMYLHDDSREAGMAYFVKAGSNGWRFLAGESAMSHDGIFEHPSWQRIRHFCREAGANSDWLSACLDGIWFEFDIDSHRELAPDIFISTNFGAATRRDLDKLIDYAFITLYDVEASEIVPSLPHLLSRLTPRCKLANLGLMLARSASGLRLELHFPESIDDIYDFLSRASWPGSLSELQGATNWMDEIASGYLLQIDLGKQMSRRLGITPHVGGERILGMDKDKWAKQFDTLRAHGLCLASKQRALLTFPGGTREIIGVRFAMLRRLSHTKIVYQPDKPLHSKVYFGIEREGAYI